jgi:CheY-like chemotaxis protein
MIFLDTQLPKISGFQILHGIRRDPYLRYTPVIMLDGNHDADIILRCYEERANCCLHKPVTPADFNQVAEALLMHEFYRNAA